MEKELIDIKSTFEGSYEVLNNLKHKITETKFSKGGDVFFRGYYTPFLSVKYGLFNNSRGRITKNEKNYTFKYGFNNNHLIYVMRNLESIITEEFIFEYKGDEIGITFNQKDKEISDITLCKYCDGKLISVCYAHIMKWMNSFSFSFTLEEYKYKEDVLMSMEEITGDTKYPTRFINRYNYNDDCFKLVEQKITKYNGMGYISN